MQSWVTRNNRSVLDEPESMQMAAENKRRIMGSSLFGDYPNQNQQNLSKTAPIAIVHEEYNSIPSSYNHYSSTFPDSDPSLSSTVGRLSDFPDLNFDTEPPPPVLSATDLGFKPKNSNYRHSVGSRRLQVPPNDQMRQLRDELNRESVKFNQKTRRILQP